MKYTQQELLMASNREHQVEHYFCRRVKKDLGGMALKWSSPGCADGVPDRVVLLPRGRTIYVEVKTADGKLSSVQKRMQKHMGDLGHRVFTVYGKEGVDRLIELVLSC